MKCFYHKSDLDGHCSGAIVKRAYPNCECVGVDYNDTLESLGYAFEVGDKVFVVDFRFNEKDMEWLNFNTELHWIDHHKTSIDRAHETGFLSYGGQLLEIGRAGCELTWEYLNESKMPETVLLLGRYDVWDHADKRVLPFQYGMREHEDTLPESKIWQPLFNDDDGSMVEKITERGKLILAYQDKQNAIYAKGMSYEGKIEGLRAIIMNKAYANSKAFDAVYDPEKHDIMVLFGIKKDEYKYTLFADKDNIDVSAIAKKYGGGGHKGAAGFYSKSQIA